MASRKRVPNRFVLPNGKTVDRVVRYIVIDRQRGVYIGEIRAGRARYMVVQRAGVWEVDRDHPWNSNYFQREG